MADWRDDERRRWTRNEGRDWRGWGGGWRDERFADDGPDYERRTGDFGRESDYGAGYAVPRFGSQNLNRRPGGMRDEQDWRAASRAPRGYRSGFDQGYGDGGPYRGYPSDYVDYGDWQGWSDSGGYGVPRFGDNYGRPREAYGRGYRNYAGGNYANSSYGNYALQGPGYPLTGPDYADSRETDRSFWNRASDEVASWVGDDEAARRREMDRRYGHRGRGPKNYVRSDERIREDVNDRLTDDWRLDASNIEVMVANGEVTLGGTVSSRDDKHHAEHLIEHLPGIRHVQNNLRVDESWRHGGVESQAVSTPVGSSGVGTSMGTPPSPSGVGGAAPRQGNNMGSTH